MNWLKVGLMLATKLPLEKFLFKPSFSSQKEEVFYRRLEEDWAQKQGKKPSIEKSPGHPAPEGISTPDTIAYQKREIGKALILLEKHLLQGCKIGGKACDCCEKHPLEIEGLAQETRGMINDPLYDELVQWVREITPITTAGASASGEYDGIYPELALEARKFRKRIMGTSDLTALMTPEQQEKVNEELRNILKEERPDERRREKAVRPKRPDMQAGSPEAPGGTESATGKRELSGAISRGKAAGGPDPGQPDAPGTSGTGES